MVLLIIQSIVSITDVVEADLFLILFGNLQITYILTLLILRVYY